MKYIIEGVKLSGKSTLSSSLLEIEKGSTIIEYRAYSKTKCDNYQLCSDLEEKLLLLAQFIRLNSNHPIILTRAHLYPFALGAALNSRITSDFLKMDSKFNIDRTLLILLVINKEDYFERLNYRTNGERDEKIWDKKWSNIGKMQSEYLSFFSKSSLPKIVLNTSEFNQAQCIEKIQTFINERGD